MDDLVSTHGTAKLATIKRIKHRHLTSQCLDTSTAIGGPVAGGQDHPAPPMTQRFGNLIETSHQLTGPACKAH
ncbi:MAG: hypothetical protein WAS21_11370 [Geminicoccaceae bacterium]